MKKKIINKIYLIGDSTCQTNGMDTSPQKGWGQVFPKLIKDEYQVINLAHNGCSTKSFRDQNRFDEVEKNIREGDLLFIQFGHNDSKEDNPLRYAPRDTVYVENLKYFCDVAVKAKAIPVILSSISRRNFDGGHLNNTHMGYDLKAIEFATNNHYHYVDMSKITFEFLKSIGDEPSKCYFMNFKPGVYKNYPEGMNDNTHLRMKGAKKICELLKGVLINTDLGYIFK